MSCLFTRLSHFTALYIKTSLVFDFDNEPISKVDKSATTLANSFINNIKSSILFIALHIWTAKYRWTEANNAIDTSGNIFLATSFQKSTAILVDLL